MAARGLGLLHAARDDVPVATGWLVEASNRRTRVPDRCQWVHAYVLDATIATALDHNDHATAAPLVATLAALAARTDMRELVVRVQLHRFRLGDETAYASARLLAADIENPALSDLLRDAATGRKWSGRSPPDGRRRR